nr:hypothetical protein [Adlercreutzia caecimuris]
MVLVELYFALAEQRPVAYEPLDGVGLGRVYQVDGYPFRTPLAVDAVVLHYPNEPAAHVVVVLEVRLAFEQLDECLLRRIACLFLGVQHAACGAKQGVAVGAHGVFYELVAPQRPSPPLRVAGEPLRNAQEISSYSLSRLGRRFYYRNPKYFEKDHILIISVFQLHRFHIERHVISTRAA